MKPMIEIRCVICTAKLGRVVETREYDWGTEYYVDQDIERGCGCVLTGDTISVSEYEELETGLRNLQEDYARLKNRAGVI